MPCSRISNGRPSLFGPGFMPTPECPLAVLDGQGRIQYLRAAQGVDEKTGTTFHVGHVPQGSIVRLTIADRDAIFNGCRKVVQGAFATYPNGKAPEAALIFSCAARKMLLGTRVPEEYGIVREILGEELPVCGFYGYGQIGPLTEVSRAAAAQEADDLLQRHPGLHPHHRGPAGRGPDLHPQRLLHRDVGAGAEYGATIDKFIGDAMLMFFGDPESRGVEEDTRAWRSPCSGR